EGVFVDEKGLIHSGIRGQPVVLVFQLTVQPEGQVAQGFADSGFRIGCHSLTSRTVPGNSDIHAVRMAVTSPVVDFSLQ
ncbi:hypothetical protein G9H12_28365, partial [Escherichia coli]|nr:hypothetical protein [Escherichia coli]